MKLLIYFSLFAFIFCLPQSILAQAVDSDEIAKSSKWELYYFGGLGISNEQRPQYAYSQINQEPEWYNPRIAGAFGIHISRKIGKHFRLSTGANYDYYAMKSEPFHVVHIGPGYFYTGTGIQPNITTDDRQSVTERHRGYVSVPLIFEYYGNGKWAPYFKLGTVFSFNVSDRSKTVFVGSRAESASESDYEIGSYSESLVFGTFGGGVQYKTDLRKFTFGLRGNIGITPYRVDPDLTNSPFPNSILLEVGIRQEIGGKRR